MNFYERVWELMKRIPKGKVTTYKIIANKLGTKAYRAVGNACNKNPYSAAPCHRVVKSDGNIGGFRGGTNKKIIMLRNEGLKIENGKLVDFNKRLFRF